MREASDSFFSGPGQDSYCAPSAGLRRYVQQALLSPPMASGAVHGVLAWRIAAACLRELRGPELWHACALVREAARQSSSSMQARLHPVTQTEVACWGVAARVLWPLWRGRALDRAFDSWLLATGTFAPPQWVCGRGGREFAEAMQTVMM